MDIYIAIVILFILLLIGLRVLMEGLEPSACLPYHFIFILLFNILYKSNGEFSSHHYLLPFFSCLHEEVLLHLDLSGLLVVEYFLRLSSDDTNKFIISPQVASLKSPLANFGRSSIERMDSLVRAHISQEI
jgi:hypothetical protein